jgi:SAM-dependent methyltransferase
MIPARPPAPFSALRLAASPDFTQSHSGDGRCFVAGETEPYPQYWLDDRERLLLALFGRRGGLRVGDGIRQMLALTPGRDQTRERRRLERAIAGMQAAGLLVAPGGERSRYGTEMAAAYRTHRPFPRAIMANLASQCGIGPGVRLLDLAAGPGSLALQAAALGADVTIMEYSRGFVAAAAAEAARLGLPLTCLNESCNRLPHHDGVYDVVTISQALHWLDDVAVCRGVCRLLAAGGRFVVIHAAMSLPETHPLAWILGNDSPLGAKAAAPFADEARALQHRLSLLFAGLQAPADRHDPLQPPAGLPAVGAAGLQLFHQPRPIDAGFARAFLSDAHIAATGLPTDQVWQRIAAECAAAPAGALTGSMQWAALHFARGAAGGPVAADWQTIAYP